MILPARRRRGASTRSGAPRRPLRAGLGVLAAAAAVAALAWGSTEAARRVLDPAAFPLLELRLEGQGRYLSEHRLRRLVEAYLGRNFFTLDINGIERAFAAEPWVEWARVTRTWPRGIRIRYRERRPFARWGEDALVDREGRTFRPDELPPGEHWPRLAGPEGQGQRVIEHYLEARERLSGLDLELTEQVLDGRGAWRLRFSDGLELRLGRERFRERLRRFAAAYEGAIAPRRSEIEAVDLRYPSGFAVQWRDASERAPSNGLMVADSAR